MADGSDSLHHVQHDPGVLGGREVSPLLGLKVSDPANLSPVLHQFEGPIKSEIYDLEDESLSMYFPGDKDALV